MAEQLYFAGRVRHLGLPTFTGPTGPDAPVLKRLLLPQGELAQFYDDPEGMRYLALIELKAGGVRGNHFHREKREFVYVISGRVELLLEDPASRERATVMLVAGDRVVIDPLVAHALRTVAPGQAIEFSPTRFNSADTVRHSLVGRGQASEADHSG